MISRDRYISNPHRMNFQNKYAAWIYGILILVSTLAALLAVKNIKTSTDAMVYSLISQEILSGNGMRLPVIRLEDNYVPVNGAIPYPEEAPLLPIFFALLNGVTPQNFLPAQIINVISHVALSIFTFLLMKKIYGNSGIALLTGILVSVSFPMLRNANRMVTESLFIALTAAALYFLTLSRHFDKSVKYLLLASICASAAILTRYPGMALIAVFIWEGFVLIKNRSVKLKYLSAFLAIILPLLVTGIVFIRNFLITGRIFGHNEPPPDRSYLEAFTGTIKMIFLQFSLGNLTVALIALFAILFIFYIIVNTSARRELSNYVHSGLDLIIAYIISYTLLLSVAMATSQTVFELRYVSPLVPFLFITGIVVIVYAWERIKLRGFQKLSLIGVILTLGIITFGNFYKSYLRSEEFLYKQDTHYSFLHSQTYNWIKENYGGNFIIATNRPYHLSFYGGYSTIVLPHKRFSPSIRIPDNMDLVLPDRMSKLGSRVLALFEKSDEQDEGSYIAGLFKNREDDDNFVLMHKFSDGVVYQLRE